MNHRFSNSILRVLGLAVCVAGVLGAGAAIGAADAPGAAGAQGEVKVEVGHNDLEHVTPEFTFTGVPAPAKDTAASGAKVSVIDGAREGNGSGDASVLTDGRLPSEEDQPTANFFFANGSAGGRLLFDLGSVIRVKQVLTYSWHTDVRGPQVYTLYAADGTAAGFNDKPGKDVDPEKAGWKLVAKVDTRPKTDEYGGQYGVSISDTAGALGKYRYLLMVVERTKGDDNFGQTFYSEVNIIDADKPAPAAAIAPGSVKMSKRLTYAIAERKAQGNVKAITELVQEPGALADAAQRAELLKKAGVLLEQFDTNVADMGKLAPSDKGRVEQLTALADPIRAALGEKDAIERLQKQAESQKAGEAAAAKAVLARAQFLTAGKDAAAQDKALDAFEAALKADRKSDAIAMLMVHSHDDKTTAPAVGDRIEKIFKETADSDTADFYRDEWVCGRKLASLTGNPLVIKMPKADGTAFSSESLKGKVVLVDLWATWCGPCVGELPRVTKIYQKYHEQGLEVVGVSCDRNAEALKEFLKEHKELAWTQLYDPKLPEWETAKVFGVLSIPRMFLIDKKGIVRTIDARENMEEMIPKLLAE